MTGYAGDVEFKRFKKPLMRPEAKPIEIDLASVIHCIEAKDLPFPLEELGSQVQSGSVKGRGWAEWGAIVRNFDLLPCAAPLLHQAHVGKVLRSFDPPIKGLDRDHIPRFRELRGVVLQEWLHASAQFLKRSFQSLMGIYFFRSRKGILILWWI